MVKRTITITTILLILTMVVSLIIVFNKSSFAADDDIASGTSGTCSWVIDANGVLTISPTDGVSGTLAEFDFYNNVWQSNNLQQEIKKIIIERGVKTGQGCSRMFIGLTNCTEMNLANLDTSSATNMQSMFGGCSSLTTLDLSSFNTENVSDMGGMFDSCSALTTIDMSNFNTGNVTNMSLMFGYCPALTFIDVSGFDTSKVTNMSNMFRNCTALTSLDLSGFNTSKVTNMSSMFSECSSLTTLDVSNFNTGNVSGMEDMFYRCIALTSIDVSGFDTSKVTDMHGMFSVCSSLSTIDLSNFNTENVTDMSYMFYGCEVLTSIDISGFDTSKVTSMSTMFYDCKLLTSIDLSSFNTETVTDMSYMFYGCEALKSIDISGFNTSKVSFMNAMFVNCKALTSVDVSGFDTSNVINMGGMFHSCSALKSVDVSGFDTSKVTSMSTMFYDCKLLTSIDLSSFNTETVTDMRYMFSGCKSLTIIKLGENYYFDGKGNIEITNNKALLPTPTGEEFTGKWIREDKIYGPYTPEELRDNYDGSTMAGNWIRERKPVTVTYSYTGTTPQGASELPEIRTYGAGESVTVAPDATAPGYTFSGWSRTGTFEMPADNVEITGSFTANTDTPYKIEHYLENLTEGEYTLVKTDNLTGTTDTEATATAKDYEGFTFDDSVVGANLSGNIAGDGSLVLKLYYKRNSYNVSYAYTGDIPVDASSLPQGETYKYGAEIIVPENATAEGYTFSGWIKDYITMPAQDIEITGYFIENPKSYIYKVEYYFDGELDDSLEEILNAEKDEEITLTPQNPVKHRERNYTLVSDNHKITISINEEENVINVYYETDVLDYEIDNSEDTIEGDGIPDKYQIKITYKVENGSWDDGTKETKTNIVTLKDKDGNYAEDGTGDLNVPQVGNKPAEGYTKGSWNKEFPNRVSKTNDGDEYIYSFKKNEIAKADITEKSVKSSNPKTHDIMPIFLLVGTAGIVVLMVAGKNRRKFGRKAKKIQY